MSRKADPAICAAVAGPTEVANASPGTSAAAAVARSGERYVLGEQTAVARLDLGRSGPLVQRKASRDDNGVAEGYERAISAASNSTGQPLPGPIQRKFESSMDSDLSGVRVHSGGPSATAAHAVGAKAYTVGQDIHFGAGHYDPTSRAGEHLLAHEVAHTVQQRGGAAIRQHKLEVSGPADAAEHEADRAADAMVTGAPATVTLAGAAIAREADPPAGGEAFDDDTISKLDAIDLSGHQAAVAKCAVAVATLVSLAGEFDNQSAFLGGDSPEDHGLWGWLTTPKARLEKDEKAHQWQEMASKATEASQAIAEFAGNLPGAVQAFENYKAALPPQESDFAVQSRSKLAKLGEDSPTKSTPEAPQGKGAAIAGKLETAAKVLAWAHAFSEGCGLVSSMSDGQSALAAFQLNPSSTTAEEWATSVGEVFDHFGNAVAAVGEITGFEEAGQFSKLFSAPKLAISGFIAAQHAYYGRIDRETKDNGSGSGQVLKPGTSEGDPQNQ